MNAWSWGTRLAIALLVLTTAGFAQPVIGPNDIPAAPGTTADFYLETGVIPVNLGPDGANRFYNFTQGPTGTVVTEEIVEPDDSPYYDDFPTANRVSFGPAPFGISDGMSWRYDQIGPANWYTLGLAITIEDFEFPFALPVPLQIAPLPLNYGDEWDQTISETMVLPTDALPLPVPIPFDSIQVEINIGAFSEVDGWGKAAIAGGVAPVLRVHSNAGGAVEGWGVVYIFNIRILIPLGELFALDATQAYTWYSPGLGEIASIVSLPGEQDPDFTEAATVRRRALLGDEAMAAVTMTPQGGEPVIPDGGGEFLYDVTLETFINAPASGDAWTSVVTPAGDEITTQLVPLNLPPNASISVSDLVQAIPGNAPPGTYEFRANLGVHPAAVVAMDSFGFTVEGAGPRVAVRNSDEWAGFGLAGLADAMDRRDDDAVTVAGDGTAAQPDAFALHAVYPNPFNAAATVAVTLPENGALTVRVVNTLGREVAVLAQGRHTAGEHRFSFDAGDLPSGVYVVQASSPAYGIRVAKAVLVK